MTFGDKLAKLRRENHHTQEQLADILCVSRQTVSKSERYYRNRTECKRHYCCRFKSNGHPLIRRAFDRIIVVRLAFDRLIGTWVVTLSFFRRSPHR
jgi:DNA-binding XRE family transcriptional regulator